MGSAEMDAIIQELRVVPKFLETAIEDAVLEIGANGQQPDWAPALVKSWERYVRWRAAVTNNPALLTNVADMIDKAAGQLREAQRIMGGKINAKPEGTDGTNGPTGSAG